MLEKLRVEIDKLMPELVKSISELIKIPSVEDETTMSDTKPQGEGCYQALKKTEQIAKNLGFTFKNVGNVAGHAQWGEGEEIVGILGHVDVVPAGTGWEDDPFSGKVEGGYIWGRGAIDDKGPTLSCLYAQKALMNLGFRPKRRIRTIVGTAEETNWKCMKTYFQSEDKPTFGFTPDGKFPIIQSEKGILHLEITAPKSEILWAYSGERTNVVPNSAFARVPDNISIGSLLQPVTEKEAMEASKCKLPEGKYVMAKGVEAHGSTPHLGHNAIVDLLMELEKAGIDHPLCQFFAKTGQTPDGAPLGINYHHEVAGTLSWNPGLLRINENESKVVVDIRYPYGVEPEEIVNQVKKHLPEGLEVKMLGVGGDTTKAPLLISADHPLIVNLQKAYNEVTKEEPTLLAIGGGTYAKAIPNTVAFGAEFPGEPMLAHKANERLSLESLRKMTLIYAYAIYLLAQ